MELDVDHLDALLTLALLALPQAKEAPLQVALPFHRGDLEGAELHHEQEHVAHDAADGVGAALQPVHAHPRREHVDHKVREQHKDQQKAVVDVGLTILPIARREDQQHGEKHQGAAATAGDLAGHHVELRQRGKVGPCVSDDEEDALDRVARRAVEQGRLQGHVEEGPDHGDGGGKDEGRPRGDEPRAADGHDKKVRVEECHVDRDGHGGPGQKARATGQVGQAERELGGKQHGGEAHQGGPDLVEKRDVHATSPWSA